MSENIFARLPLLVSPSPPPFPHTSSPFHHLSPSPSRSPQGCGKAICEYEEELKRTSFKMLRKNYKPVSIDAVQKHDSNERWEVGNRQRLSEFAHGLLTKHAPLRRGSLSIHLGKEMWGEMFCKSLDLSTCAP